MILGGPRRASRTRQALRVDEGASIARSRVAPLAALSATLACAEVDVIPFAPGDAGSAVDGGPPDAATPDGGADAGVPCPLAELRVRSPGADGGLSNGPSHGPRVGPSGDDLAFASRATDLPGAPGVAALPVAYGGWKGQPVRRVLGRVDHADRPVPSTSGNYVAFESSRPLRPGDDATSTDVFLWRRESDELTGVSFDARGRSIGGTNTAPDLASDARFVAFLSTSTTTGLAGPGPHVLVFDRDRGALTAVSRISVENGPPSVGLDGRVTFAGRTTAGVEIFTYEVAGDRLVRHPPPVPIDSSRRPRLAKQADVLVLATGAGAFLTDLAKDEWIRLDRTIGGGFADRGIDDAWPSPSGRFVVLSTRATNLDPRDVDGGASLYWIDRSGGGVSLLAETASTDLDVGEPTPDRLRVVFASDEEGVLGRDGPAQIVSADVAACAR